MPAETFSCDSLPSGTLSVEQAQERILQAIAPITATETVALRDALGRILAQDLSAPLNVPAFTNSAMDGYAIRHTDLARQPLKVIGTAFAGKPFLRNINAGECVRIMTGAVVPDGADCIAIQENVQREGDFIQIRGDIALQEYLRFSGDDIKQGELLLAKNRRLNAADLGLLASQGIAQVPVLRRPKIAFCSTGDELKSLGEDLGLGDIYDSNRYTLYALLKKLDVEILDWGVIKDTREAVEALFQQARHDADLVITSGGVSVGEADYIADTLERLGQVNFWKIAVKPGKPLAFGKVGNCHFFGLPGNPVSVMATFLLFVRPAILQLRGEAVTALPEYTAICETPIKKEVGRKDYQRGICWLNEQQEWRVRTTGGQGSHILRSMSQANCFIPIPLELGNLAAGSKVNIIPFENLL
ncbi:gephyrin-like molybdotransferase Glp [Thiolinea disciformis]|uniref:molybdopterin molybdotransferase MoeA n=1 Tax=Thiolinea disciformis TaxID=125614 RepID=UPI00036BE569|nr:gephyrin-like molybdotransferase Glp [Thiolinea disciformis]